MNTEGDKGEVLAGFEEGAHKGRNYSEYFENISGSHLTKPSEISIKEAP
jgi:hypothetical protein